jgi:hypothetical protein
MHMSIIMEALFFHFYPFLLFSYNFPFQFKMQPKVHYAEDDCPLAAPDGFPKDDELQFEIEMLDFFKAKVSLLK